MNITLDTLSSMDWVVVTDMEDKENSAEMEIVNAAEILTGENETGLFMLITDLSDDFDEDEEESDEAEAFIFKVCGEEEAEFMLTEKNRETLIYVTTTFDEKEYDDAAKLFQETTAEFDIDIEED